LRRAQPLLVLISTLALGTSLALVAPAAQAQTTLRWSTTTQSPAESDVAAYLVRRINAARAAHGLAPLTVRADLTRHARAHSGRMAVGRQLFHTPSLAVICCWSAIAENVAYDRTARGAHRGLMASPGHRANILHPSMRAVGVGVVRSHGVYWVTQVFRRPR
jgi:uncharacterized protein YkwD